MCELWESNFLSMITSSISSIKTGFYRFLLSCKSCLFVCVCFQACRDFLALAQAHSKRWQKALQAEREQRVRLEETLEQLAKQHNHLERAFRGATVLPALSSNTTADSKGTHTHQV